MFEPFRWQQPTYVGIGDIKKPYLCMNGRYPFRNQKDRKRWFQFKKYLCIQSLLKRAFSLHMWVNADPLMRVKFILVFFAHCCLKCCRLLQLFILKRQRLFDGEFFIFSARSAGQWLQRQLSICHHILFCIVYKHGHFYTARCCCEEGEAVNGGKINFHRSSKTDEGHFFSENI